MPVSTTEQRLKIKEVHSLHTIGENRRLYGKYNIDIFQDKKHWIRTFYIDINQVNVSISVRNHDSPLCKTDFKVCETLLLYLIGKLVDNPNLSRFRLTIKEPRLGQFKAQVFRRAMFEQSVHEKSRKEI